MSDLYALLGVPRDAPEAEIKKAYRRLAMQYHPDRNPAPGAEAKFKEVTEAYEVLREPARRAQYDRFGTTGTIAIRLDSASVSKCACWTTCR